MEENMSYRNIISISALLIIMSFSPLISYFTGLIYLFIFKRSIKNIDVRIISFLIALSGSIIVVSREAFVINSDDMERYYILYQEIENLILPFNTQEVGLKIVYYLLKLYLGELSIHLFIFLHCFLISLLFLIFIFRAIRYFNLGLDSRFISLSLLLFSLFMTNLRIPVNLTSDSV